ncbi:peptidylprolyl isomerase [Synechococcus sp. RedBA-s]|uniref:peptidylprolyl isomerase n=1 Tax=Synechococcus sp. RedBA-s TaxID=2823741 RepID=UPI0020CDA141|nr:peptidylprolyl isomerase [Synechococcus sp. RedBA-s]MCP9799182.1 peptidylprolyl isomerase [Synechococcus sp. RedBA-s]
MTPHLEKLPPEVLKLLSRHSLLRKLVQAEVVQAAVGTEALSDAEAEEAAKAFRQRFNNQNEEAIATFTQHQGLTKEALEWQIQLPSKIKRHCLEHFMGKAESHFLSRKNQLDQAVYSLIRVRDPYLARELYLRLDAGEADFAELASTHSEGMEKSTRGIVGPAPLTRAHPLLAERLRTSTPGEVQEPISIEGWWLILRLESLQPATFDEKSAGRMAGELFELWVQEETSRRLAKLPIFKDNSPTE